MGGHTTEIRPPVFILRDPLAIIADPEIERALLFPPNDDDLSGARIDAVFYKLGDGL
jgi:hypothetical protein